ncbi:endonuclease/exonuclease/phosphatase family protein [Pelagibacterium sediminicola]|uniref:endonuclease/exonuclease/phosphatase family protein n=1 Tax=Pelagibacterium sediminicola TaxID=2248761 RepID=UPI000E315E8B|nr:endonuclease/exonuclease/phosphatase family protein [Pelagibacterium sediminicola]
MLPGIVAGLYFTGCLLLGAMAVTAVLGFAHPVADLFNHAQPVLFYGLLAAMLFCGFFVRTRLLRPLTLAIAATGFAASAMTYVPEFVDGFAVRHAPLPVDRPVYSLMTFNVFGRNSEPDVLADYIIATDADIVALQEYSPEVRRAIHPALAGHYVHFQYCAGGQRAFVGLYSKFAFEPLSEDACSPSIANPERIARIVVGFAPEDGAPFALATTHHDWPAPVTRQAEQFASLRDALSTVALPLMLVGDFNSTPWSYALRRFVTEAGLTRHTFNLPTFPKLWYYLRGWRWTPAFLPIDHVMSRGGISVHEIERGEPSGSDHLPIILRFSVGDV